MEKKFKPARQDRVSVEVVKQLKSAILSGQFTSGQKIPTERELTEQFQVSRVVVREAVRELELTGFVKIFQGPAGGAFVTDLSFDRLAGAYADLFHAGKLSTWELLQVRLHLEPEVARLAALHVSPDWARRIEEIAAAERVRAVSHQQWVRNNIALHYVLAEMCGNRLHRAIVEPLLRLTEEIVLVVKPERTVFHDHAEHEAIAAAVAAGNGDAAKAAMAGHLSRMEKPLEELEQAYREKAQRAGWKQVARSPETP